VQSLFGDEGPAGNLPPLYGIFPDYSAPIVRNQPNGRELMMARWGLPSPVFALKGKKSNPGVTNVRNVKSPHWRRWLGVESRCRTAHTGSHSTRRGRLLSLRASGHAGPPSERYRKARRRTTFSRFWREALRPERHTRAGR
jgi:hypothetical protein